MLDKLTYDYKTFLDKTTILYGASGSGKSKFIIDILFHLNKHAKQIIVISPTDPTNRTYSGTDDDPGVVLKPLIHYKLTEQLLLKIWARQEMFSAVYSRANQFTVLEKLFHRLDLVQVRKMLDQADAMKAEKLSDIEDQYVDTNIRKKKKSEIEEQFQEFHKLVYKKYIATGKASLERMELSVDEKYALKYLSFNPRMVLILDDCSSDFKKIKSKEGKSVLEKMFFQNRWAYLTVLIGVHDDKLLDSELRKNAFVSIFTTAQSAYTYFKRDANAFPKATLSMVTSESPEIFQGFQKLAYIRQHDKFYRVTATCRDDQKFHFGGISIKEYCKRIQSQGIAIDKNNEFYTYFSTP